MGHGDRAERRPGDGRPHGLLTQVELSSLADPPVEPLVDHPVEPPVEPLVDPPVEPPPLRRSCPTSPMKPPAEAAVRHADAVNDPQPPWQAWKAWLNTLDASQRAAAESLRSQWEALGVSECADLIRWEICEGSPQLARFMLLRSLWRAAIDGWSEPTSFDQLPAAQRLLAAGADRDDVARLARAAAYEAVFATLYELDTRSDVNAPGVDAGWIVMETGEDGSPTGRALADLHEDLLTLDPSGRDGADLWR